MGPGRAPWHRGWPARESMGGGQPVFAGGLPRGSARPNSPDPGAVALHLTGGASQSYKALCPHSTLRFNIMATPSHLPISLAPLPASTMSAPHNSLESFSLGPITVPRLWNGLWQLSSNAWGSAPANKIRRHMAQYAEQGYTAFGMLSRPHHACLWLTRPCCRHGECPPALPPSSARTHRLTGPPRLYHRVCPQLLGAVTPDRNFTMQICLPADHYGSAELLFVRAILIRAPR